MICSVEPIYENIKVTEGIYRLSIKGDFKAKPGQFYMLKVEGKEPLLPRPISVHEVEEDKIVFLYQVVGLGTALLSKLKPQEEIQIMGPLGNGFDVEKINGKIAMVSGGIGIAPMVYLAKQLQHCEIDFYAGFRTVDYCVENVEENVRNIYLSTEDGSKGHKGYVTDLLQPEKYDMVLCCGPEIMMKKVIKQCKEAQVPVYVSMENHMACGIGACLVCTCETKEGNKRTCKEGPVFSGEDLIFHD